MKIDNRPRDWKAPRNVTRTDAAQTGKFQQALATCTSLREPEDTITISGRTPTVEEPPVSVAASGAVSVPNAAEEAVRNTASRTASTEILSGDSIDVKLAKLRKMAEEADYTGMGYGEIYSSIWNRYNNAFGGNWAAIMFSSSIQEKGDLATSQFRAECNRNINGPLRQEFKAETGINVMTWSKDNWPQHERDMAAYRSYVLYKYGNFHAQPFGYAGMTTEEAEKAIYEKYKGKNTLRDFLNMQGELFESGIMTDKLGANGAAAYWGAINDQLSKTYFFNDYTNGTVMNISQSRWNTVLDGKFDVHAFAADMRESLKNATFTNWDFDIEKAISQGIDYLLTTLG